MADNTTMRDLFDRWEQVWVEGRFDLVPGCVAPTYLRHEQAGDRAVTRDAYAAELAQLLKDRPNIRVVVYDHTFQGERAWFRFAFTWRDKETGEARSQAGMQSYRTEGGKLVETWISLMPLGSGWSDRVAQEHWTSPPPGK
jgi:predicted SnoaL-like aldol condensation-catalyzing enzyme